MSSNPQQHQALMEQVTHHPDLKHLPAGAVHDRSSPAIEPGTGYHPFDKKPLLHEVQKGVHLKHVGIEHDASTPAIDESTVIHPSPVPALMCEIKAVGAHKAVVNELKTAGSPGLKHVATNDKGSPAIPPDAHIKKWDKDGLMADIKASPSKQLHHVVHPNDRSAPATEGAKVTHSHAHSSLMDDINEGAALTMLPAEEVADRSSPVVLKTASMRLRKEKLDTTCKSASLSPTSHPL